MYVMTVEMKRPMPALTLASSVCFSAVTADAFCSLSGIRGPLVTLNVFERFAVVTVRLGCDADPVRLELGRWLRLAVAALVGAGVSCD